MSDLIRREDVEKTIQRLCDLCGEDERYNGVMCGACNLDNFIRVLDDIPSAKPDMDEWCTECKEYDKEKHCCPRWNKVIRQTVEEMQMMGKIAKVIEHKYFIGSTLNIVGEPKSGYEYLCGNCKKKVICGDEYCSHCGARLEWNHE